MKSQRTILNKFILALCALLSLLVVKSNCCCKPMEATAHAASMQQCCREMQEDSDCCKSIPNASFQALCCFCNADQSVVGQSKVSATPGSNPAAVQRFQIADAFSADDDERNILRKLQLHNDELKPSKIYILNRSLLN